MNFLLKHREAGACRHHRTHGRGHRHLCAGLCRRLKIATSVLNDTSILCMLALAQMMVILTRGIDLSVASNLALSGMISASLAQNYPDLPVIAFIARGHCHGPGARPDQRQSHCVPGHPAHRRDARHARHLPRHDRRLWRRQPGECLGDGRHFPVLSEAHLLRPLHHLLDHGRRCALPSGCSCR